MISLTNLPPSARLSEPGRHAALRVLSRLHEAEGRGSALPPPGELLRQIRPSLAAQHRLAAHRRQIAAVLTGEDPRLLVVVGPCSVHDPVAMLDYAERLSTLADRVSDSLVLCLRVYFDKPRTQLGWKGFINDPHLDGRCDIAAGLVGARSLLCELAEMDLPLASELLDPIAAAYVVDLLSWAAIGARTSQSQPHRELASGLSMPVGLKNPTCGDIASAIGGLRAIAAPHRHLSLGTSGRPVVAQSAGNPNAHLVLRGGRSGPNCDSSSVREALRQLEAAGLPARLMVDASHGNSRKQPERQPDVVAELVRQLAAGQAGIRGIMLESHLVAGNQPLGSGPLTYGQSVTDACIGFEETKRLLLDLSKRVRPLSASNRATLPELNEHSETAASFSTAATDVGG